MVIKSAFGQLGGPMQAMGHDGQIRSMAESLKSQCGDEFDEYVMRLLGPFPHDSMNPASRTIDNLWNGRRFQLRNNTDDLRQGKVAMWRQYNTGPFCPITFWELQAEIAFGPGDKITLVGLQAAQQHNGKKGTIIKFLPEEGRYKVILGDREKKVLAVKPENMKKQLITTYAVHRMNVESGGILFLGERRDNPISLEWLDPVLPEIDPTEGP